MRTAAADLVDLDEMIGQLDPERATRELKDLLRRRHRNPTAVDDRTVATMRRRYETIHGLQDRRAALVDRIDRTIADLEGLAANSFELDRSSRDRDPSRDLAALNDDLAALASAHAELDAEIPDLSGGR